jgi:hypothetical protein
MILTCPTKAAELPTPAVTSLFDHEWRWIGERLGRQDQQAQLDERRWSSVFSIAEGKRERVAGFGCLDVGPGDQKLCVSERGPNQRREWKSNRSQRREEGL